MESSIRRIRLPSISSWTGSSFIRAIRLRFSWIVGIKERGQVGVYLMKGLENGIPEALAYPIACAVPESGTPAVISASSFVKPSLPAMLAPQRYRISSTETPS